MGRVGRAAPPHTKGPAISAVAPQYFLAGELVSLVVPVSANGAARSEGCTPPHGAPEVSRAVGSTVSQARPGRARPRPHPRAGARRPALAVWVVDPEVWTPTTRAAEERTGVGRTASQHLMRSAIS